jgi:hypothetical protein
MKICVLGNSHLAAFKLGWEQIAQATPGVTVDFFGLGRNTFRHTALQEGAIVPTKPELVEKMRLFSGGHDRIEPARYGAFVITGLVVGLPRVLRFLSGHGIAGEVADRPQIVSYEMFQDAFDAEINATPMPHLVDMIRQVSQGPIINFMRPLRSAVILEEDKRRKAFYEAQIASGDMPYAADLLDRLMTPHLKGAMVALRQPEETTVGGVLTDKRFSVGSTRLRDESEAHDEDDISHMNGDYGAICMTQVLDVLGVAAQPRSTITEPTE